MNSRFPLYRHYKLYENSISFQRYKYIKESDYNRMSELRKSMENSRDKAIREILYDEEYDFIPKMDDCDDKECEAPCCDEAADPESIFNRYINYKKRYTTLRHTGYFYSNIETVLHIVNKSESVEMFRMKCTIDGLDESKVNYAILYVITAPTRFFRRDWSKFISSNNIKRKIMDNLSSYDLESLEKYLKINDIYQDIIKTKAKISNFKEFTKELI